MNIQTNGEKRNENVLLAFSEQSKNNDNKKKKIKNCKEMNVILLQTLSA